MLLTLGSRQSSMNSVDTSAAVRTRRMASRLLSAVIADRLPGVPAAVRAAIVLDDLDSSVESKLGHDGRLLSPSTEESNKHFRKNFAKAKYQINSNQLMDR